jgi:hypothetical protein
MTCSECQDQIFDGELGQDALVHLTGCDECRVLDREVRLNASAMAAMREDVVPVRSRRRWRWVVAAAATVLAVIGFAYRPEPVAVPQQVAVVEPHPVAPVLPKPVAAKRVPARRVRPAKTVQQPAEPLLVKFLTDDPDIVIYWLIDPVQGEQAL